MTGVDYRGRYLQDSIATASPAKLLTMLYDRLALDLRRAESAQREGDRSAAAVALLHAQDIVLELHTTLDPSQWAGGPGLSALYAYLHAELIRANISGEADRTAACLALVEPLREAWHQAVGEASPQQPGSSA